MSPISNFPPLSALQSSLAQAVGTLPALASERAFQAVREIPGFQNLSGLNALASQDSLSRMVVSPILFDDVSKVLNGFDDLPALRETFALPTLDERLGVFAQILDLRHGVQIFLAGEIQPGEGEAKRLVEGALKTVGKSMSRALKDELLWPHQLTFQSVGSFAVSVRKTYDAREDHLNPQQRFHLMRLATYMNVAASEVCRWEASENRTPSQAVKMAALMEVLYGCGFGNDHTTAAAERLYRLPRAWATSDPATRDVAFRLAAEEIDRLLSEIKAADETAALPAGAGTRGAAAQLRAHRESLGID